MNRLSKISVFTAALALLSLSHASYADQKTYPGSDCQVMLSEDPPLEGVEIECPIVRDNIANTNGTKEAWVRVASHNGGVFRCTLFSQSASGAIIASKTASTTATGNQVLNVDVNASANSGFYNLFCELPCLQPDFGCDTGVVSYRINEY